MPKRVYYLELPDRSSVELVDLEAGGAAETFKLRLDRPGVSSVSVELTLGQVQEIANAAWHDHEENGGATGAPGPPSA